MTEPTTILKPEELQPAADLSRRTLEQLDRILLGRKELHRLVLIGILSKGHVLFEGVPGLGKTALVRTVGQILQLEFKRIQFTPDLMPGDILGTHILQQTDSGKREMVFQPGPVFTNILLADEINRTPPKTQSALLEAMQERSCTVRGNIYTLPSPFFVLATQNPIELEGTYPLPEAQLDRFLFNTVLDYLSASEEQQVVDLTTVTTVASADPVTTAKEIVDFQQLVRMVPIGASVSRYVVDMVRLTRSSDENAPDFVKKYVNYGGSVRAAQFLVLAAKARALMKGRYHVTYEDVRALYIPVLRHRILLNFHAESDRLKQDDILKKILEFKPAPRD
jgi:MoxR-like ATPase